MCIRDSSFSDRSTLWNSVELYEKAGHAQLAREIDAALPIELSREEQIRLVREYCSYDALEKMDLSHVKLMWTNYPNMPTGGVAKRETYEKLVAFAQKHKIVRCV